MSSKQNEIDKDYKNDVALCRLLALLALGGFIYTNEKKIKAFYFYRYEEIYLTLWGLVLVMVMFAIYFVKKKTKEISKRGELLSPLWTQTNDTTFIGTTKDSIGLHLSDEARCSHVQIIGSTGRGKTQSVIIPWALNDLYRGKSVLLIDGKGSKDVPYVIKNKIIEFGIQAKYFEFDLDKPNASVQINPLKSGTPQQITDRIFSAFEFDDPFYRSVQYDICGYLVRLIKENNLNVTFRLLHDLLCDEKALTAELAKLEDGSALKKKLTIFLKSAPNERAKNLAGLVSQISPFATGEIAGFVNGGENEVLIEDILRSGGKSSILLMSIPTLKYQKIGHQLGKLVLQNLAWVVGEREKEEDLKFCSVFLDEFSEFAYEGFISILSKARSSKVALHLSHQSMGDLSKVSDEFALGVNTNTNIKCIMGLNDPETADFYARHLGTFSTQKMTEQVEETGIFKRKENTGRGSMREVESYKVHPNVLKELFNGRGVLHVPTSRGSVTEVIQFQSISRGGQ